MKSKKWVRFLSCLLSLSLFLGSVCGAVSAQADTVERKMITWKGQALADEAAKTGLLNRQGQPIFTTYQDQIGVQAPKGSNDYMIHSWNILHVQGETPMYQQGDILYMAVRVWNPDDDLEEGEFITPELCYDWSGVNAVFGETMTAEDYWNAETYIDETYGYQYKEWSVTAILEEDVYDQTELFFQIRVRSHGNGTLNLYGLSVYNETSETTLVEANGMQFSGQSNLPVTSITQGDTATGIVSYCGEPYAGRGEPYSKYNANGIQGCTSAPGTATDIVSDPAGALLLSGFATPLSAGQYTAEFTFFTQFSLGVEKAIFSVMRGDETVATLPYTVFNVIENLGEGKADLYGLYDTVRLEFAVEDTLDGEAYSIKVVLVNQTDFYLRDISLYKKIATDATPDQSTQAALDAVDALNFSSNIEDITAAQNLLNALTLDQRIWVDDSVYSKLDTLSQFQNDCSGVIDAIGAIGEVTEANYAELISTIQSAEQCLQELTDKYGEEAVAAVSNREILVQARAEYNRIAAAKAEEAKQAAIQKANDAINAIGSVDEINADNYQAKQELVTAAEAAVKELTDAYGEEILPSVTNYAVIAEAKAKIEEVILSTQYTLGDVTEDDEINASDALMALQHSVKLITLADNSFSAADVDASGVVDATDALYILQYSVELIDAFPVEQ